MAAKKKAKTAAGNGNAQGEREILVRMYNVGFGDAFLVQIPEGNGHRRILFDCGSIQAAPDRPMKEVVGEIVEDTRDADGISRIDVVVGTHRHKDHVSGFSNAAWSDVEVQEVWMPWTEHPTDPHARRIRETQSGLAVALSKGLQLKVASLAPGAAQPADLQRSLGIVENALMLSNEPAMKTLHSGFAGHAKRRFLPVGGQRTFTTEALPGVTVHVMGPARTDDVIRDMDPPQGESYLRMSTLQSRADGNPPAPFSRDFEIEYGRSITPQDIADIQRAGSLSDLAVAVALDKAVNGTSLMLMLDIAGTHLLFPGDAQWGTWQAAMLDPQWREMLKRTDFYKIGHHGSHNATPKDFVTELLPDNVSAMASTCTRDIWPNIPRSQLLAAMTQKHAHIARSDQVVPAGGIFTATRAGIIETRIPI